MSFQRSKAMKMFSLQFETGPPLSRVALGSVLAWALAAAKYVALLARLRISIFIAISFCMLLTSPFCSAQGPIDTSRWANVSGWKGTLTISGNGSGNITTACPNGTETYTNVQQLFGSPSLQGAFPGWFGTVFPQSVSLKI